jgi:uncharacterized protein (DUF1810 family)
MNDPFNLRRFVEAQQSVYASVISELQAGEKQSHWMWFIFPQVKGLGSSYMARKFAIASIDEARAYLNHPVLGQRLIECTRLVNQGKGRTAEEIFGYIDSLKFRSSMTLFAAAAPEREEFQLALNKYYDGKYDELTLKLI